MGEAAHAMRRFGFSLTTVVEPDPAPAVPQPSRRNGSLALALTLAALAWGLVNFGFLLWLPSMLAERGRDVSSSSALIAQSALIAIPTVAIATWMYSAWSTKWSLVVMIGITCVGLLAFAIFAASPSALDPLVPLVLLMVGACGLISMLLPYTAETSPLWFRGRAGGWIAGCSKAGGLAAQGFVVAGRALPIAKFAGVIALIAVASLFMIARAGRETRGQALSDT